MHILVKRTTGISLTTMESSRCEVVVVVEKEVFPGVYGLRPLLSSASADRYSRAFEFAGHFDKRKFCMLVFLSSLLTLTVKEHDITHLHAVSRRPVRAVSRQTVSSFDPPEGDTENVGNEQMG